MRHWFSPGFSPVQIRQPASIRRTIAGVAGGAGWLLAMVWLLLTAAGMRHAGQTGPAQWGPAMEAFVRQDRAQPPPRHGVLFIGSSSIHGWSTLAEDFPGVPVINRGFGGSAIADSTY